MIGQKVLLDRISGQIERGKFPRFSVLIGEVGSGKHTIAYEIAKKLHATAITSGISVEQIRFIIEDSYKIAEPIVYVIPDCDNISGAAANALLKVTEEPPQNAYFILTCENEENLLSTIRSRGVTYMLEPYTYENKLDFLAWEKQLNETDETFVLEVSSNLGEISYLLSIDISAFREYVELVIDNIAEVSDSNAFKIGEKIALKDEEDKYNLKLFWKAFNAICVDRMREGDDPVRYARAIGVTGDYAQQLNIRGINKQMLFDNWLLSIREEWA